MGDGGGEWKRNMVVTSGLGKEKREKKKRLACLSDLLCTGKLYIVTLRLLLLLLLLLLAFFLLLLPLLRLLRLLLHQKEVPAEKLPPFY